MRKRFLPNTAKFLTILLLSVVLISSKAFSGSLTYQWTGTAGDSMWTNAANWVKEPGGLAVTDWPGDSSLLINVIIPSSGVTTFPTIVDAGPQIQSITISAGAFLTINDYGNLTTRGTFIDSGTLTVQSYGCYLYLAGASNTNYGTINVNTSGDIEDSTSFINNGTIDISDNNSSQFLFDANLTNTGSIYGAAADFSGAGGIVMTGYTSNAQSISGKGVINDIYIDTNTTVTITAGDSVFLSGILCVIGNLHTNNVLVLTSDSVNTGIIGTSTGSITGNITIEQYIPGGRRAYRFWGHPFSSFIALSQIEKYIDITGTGGSISGFTTTTTNNSSSSWYNTTTGNSSMPNDPGWTAFTNTNGLSVNAFSPGEGILLFIRRKGQGLTGCQTCYTPKATTISMYGPVNQGNVNVTLHKGVNSDYNQVSNPYPCQIDLNLAIATAEDSNQVVGSAFYVWDPYMASNGAFQAITIDTVSFTSYVIAPNTSFQVRAAFDGAVLSFNEGTKPSGVPDTGSTRLLRKPNPNGNPFNYVTLDIYDATSRLWDIFHLKFNSDATDALDDYDATKPTNTDLNFYSYSSDDKMLAIDARPYQSGQVIPMGINTSLPQTFTIKTDEFSVPSGGELFLHDKYLSQYIQLELGTSYTFDISSDPASQGANRFELISGEPAGLYNVNGATGFETALVPNPAAGQVNVSFKAQKEGDASIVIKNLIGQQFYSEKLGTLQSGNVNVSLEQFPAGVYIAEIKCGDDFVAKKFIKQ